MGEQHDAAEAVPVAVKPAVHKKEEHTKGETNGMNEEQLVYASFMQFDADHNGAVTVSELSNVLTAFDTNQWTKAHISKLVSDVDANQDSKLQFNEFKIFLHTSEVEELGFGHHPPAEAMYRDQSN